MLLDQRTLEEQRLLLGLSHDPFDPTNDGIDLRHKGAMVMTVESIAAPVPASRSLSPRRRFDLVDRMR